MAAWTQTRESGRWTWEYADLRMGRWCRVILEHGFTTGWQAAVTLAATAQFQSLTFEAAAPGAPPGSAASFQRLQDFLSVSGLPQLPLEALNAAITSPA